MESVPCVTWNGLWVAEKGLETLSRVLGVGSASGGTENGPCDYTNASILVDSNRMEMWRWESKPRQLSAGEREYLPQELGPYPCSAPFWRRWPRACGGGWLADPASSPRRMSISTLNRRITRWAPRPGGTSCPFGTGLLPSPWRLSVDRGTWLPQRDWTHVREDRGAHRRLRWSDTKQVMDLLQEGILQGLKGLGIVCPMQQWCLRDRPSRGGMAMGRGPGAEDWGGGLPCSLKRSYVALRCGPVPLRHCGSHRGMRWCCGTAGMDDDHWRNGVIWTGKDACCGRSPVGGLPTTSKGPLEEATGPVAVTGGDNKWYTDCMTAWLAAATAWVPDEDGGNPEAGDVTVDVGVVDSLPTMLSGLVIEPEGLWEGGNGTEGKFIEAVSATSLPGQSQGDGGSMYLCLDRRILAPGGADDVRKRRVRPKHGPGSGIRPGWGLVYCADPHWVWTRISARPSRATHPT